jgi:Zn-finger in ubiquitin-hydrolases and other protein
MKEHHEHIRGINASVKPSGDGCAECLASGGWWLHLRRCAECGHIGCCDNSPSQHATKHFHASGHPVIASFEPGEDWFYDYEKQVTTEGLALAPPRSHPEAQPVPGPEGRVPRNWRSLLNDA